MYANDICKLEFMRDSDLMALKKKDLDKYLEDFLATKEQRMRNFEKFIRDSGNTSMVFDYTPESLVELWKWFRPFVKFVERTQKELDAEAAATPEKFRRFVPERLYLSMSLRLLLKFHTEKYMSAHGDAVVT